MPQLGEERRDVYMLAAEAVQEGHMLRRMTRPKWGVKKSRGRNDWNCGIALGSAKKGSALWVRILGVASVRAV